MSKAKKAKATRIVGTPKRKVIPMPCVETRHPKGFRADEAGPPVCVDLPAGPATGKAYLMIVDGVISWEPA